MDITYHHLPLRTQFGKLSAWQNVAIKFCVILKKTKCKENLFWGLHFHNTSIRTGTNSLYQTQWGDEWISILWNLLPSCGYKQLPPHYRKNKMTFNYIWAIIHFVHYALFISIYTRWRPIAQVTPLTIYCFWFSCTHTPTPMCNLPVIVYGLIHIHMHGSHILSHLL